MRAPGLAASGCLVLEGAVVATVVAAFFDEVVLMGVEEGAVVTGAADGIVLECVLGVVGGGVVVKAAVLEVLAEGAVGSSAVDAAADDDGPVENGAGRGVR